ncbi:hypothetical protein TNCV_970991 [Trichonephila clavipes]|nr:hypothetical protein TNCV_970991 [Trichonephila clavipes]
MSDQGPRNSSRERTRCASVISCSFEHHTGVSMTCLGSAPISKENTLEVVRSLTPLFLIHQPHERTCISTAIYKRRIKHFSKMSKNGLKQISQEITVFNGIFWSQVKWADIENYIEFSSKVMPDIKIDDNCLFEVERRLNVYLNSNKLEQLENQRAEKLVKYG